ncbi:MAG TPA: hypothetical protein VGS22_12530 [Thermoanaerobaculia bacterium]|nr:hypothetical protein [Thermoanaerobaculia bacterium]
MSNAIRGSHETTGSLSSTLSRLLAGLFLCVALLSATPASAAGLDWNRAAWTPNGTLGPKTFVLSNGISVTITVIQPAGTTGIFSNGTPSEDCMTSTPAGQCPNNNFGTGHDLGIEFNPAAGTPPVTSPILVQMDFSPAITALNFDISDIDYSIGSTLHVDFRRDQVVLSSMPAATPALTFKNPMLATHTFSINNATSTATANCNAPANPAVEDCNSALDTANPNTDTGTLNVDYPFPQALTRVTITYNEAGSGSNPASRGIGVLANLVETPVELTNFTIE